MFAQLAHNDLTKRGGARLDIFVDKIKKGDGFLTTKGEIILNKTQAVGLRAKMDARGFTMDFEGTVGGKAVTVKYPKDFFKTPDFGGKGVGFGTQAEDRELSVLQSEIERAMAEDRSGALDMRVGGRVVNVVGVVSTPGVPKSDFHLVDDKGQAVAWISHKDGKAAKGFPAVWWPDT